MKHTVVGREPVWYDRVYYRFPFKLGLVVVSYVVMSFILAIIPPVPDLTSLEILAHAVNKAVANYAQVVP